MDTYVADTHSLIWFVSEDDRLSKRAGRILEQAEESKIEVLIPTIVLAEITYPELFTTDRHGTAQIKRKHWIKMKRINKK